MAVVDVPARPDAAPDDAARTMHRAPSAAPAPGAAPARVSVPLPQADRPQVGLPRPERQADRPTAWPRPTRPRVSFRAMRGLHRLLEANRFWNGVAVRLEASPMLRRAFTWTEAKVKGELFGCRMCGQCALPSTAYACPMTCPKQLRNGPCGGVAMDGSCEVYPGQRCVWLIAYERAEQDGRVADLRRLQRPIDQRKWGESSWINYWRGRDEGLWTEDDGLRAGFRELPILPAPSRR